VDAWLTIAQTLPTNQSQRANCECGSGNTLIINHNPKCYSAHCFRCDRNEYHDKGIQTLEQLAELRKLNEEAQNYKPAEVTLPEDFTTEIPLEGRLWLYEGGLTPTTWKAHGIGYSPKLKRVVLPVYNEGKLVWLQCRSLIKGQKPKYLQPSLERSTITFHHAPEGADKSVAVVVEDILSAIRVGKFVPTYSLLGTKITDGQVNQLAQHDKVITWMDNDTAGKSGSRAIRRSVGLLADVANILTETDPKTLSDQRIKEELCQQT
tara:strand:+ start:4629 stop:5420 length:792 start_codon:yes stop_codon:yes gene_type:complete